MNNISLSKALIEQDDIDAVIAVLKSGTLSLGPKLAEFEKDFATYTGRKHAIAVNSGTSGLHLVMKALGIGEGDEVITSPFSFIASSNSIMFEGAKPVFVDINKDSYNIDPTLIEAAITPRTKAILPVHVFGLPCEMDQIENIAKKHNLLIIEDSCEAIGTTYNERKVGTFGEASVFAFYPNKQMTTGEGGMIVTDNDDVARLCRSYRNQGRDSMAWLGHSRIGYNYRLDEMSCALGVSQLAKIERILAMREHAATQYRINLENIPDILLPITMTGAKQSWFVFVIQVLSDIDRDDVISRLKERGIATNIYFPSIHLQEFYKNEFGFKEGDFPICEKISKRTIALPFYSEITDAEIKYICENLVDVINSHTQEGHR